MSKILPLILVCAFSSKALADCSPVTPLNAGDAAPCQGFLFTPAKELQLRLMNEDYKYLKEQTDLYIQQKELYKKELETTQQIADKEAQKAELWRHQAEDSTQKLTQMQDRQGYRDWAFLLSGIALTTLAAWSVGQAHK